MDSKIERRKNHAEQTYTDRLSHSVIGAALEVHKTLGPGYLEIVYERALAIEFQLRNIPFTNQVLIKLDYKRQSIGENRLDFIIDNLIVVELKSIDLFAPIHTAQMISYLKSSKCKVGLLLNFNVPVLKHGIRRFIL
jgi:GxxExxY protein